MTNVSVATCGVNVSQVGGRFVLCNQPVVASSLLVIVKINVLKISITPIWAKLFEWSFPPKHKVKSEFLFFQTNLASFPLVPGTCHLGYKLPWFKITDLGPKDSLNLNRESKLCKQ